MFSRGYSNCLGSLQYNRYTNNPTKPIPRPRSSLKSLGSNIRTRSTSNTTNIDNTSSIGLNQILLLPKIDSLKDNSNITFNYVFYPNLETSDLTIPSNRNRRQAMLYIPYLAASNNKPQHLLQRVRNIARQIVKSIKSQLEFIADPN